MDSAFSNTHSFLAEADDVQEAMHKVRHFFATTVLVRYDEVLMAEENGWSAADDSFGAELELGVSRNRQLLKELLAELGDEGFADLDRWETMPQGYLSKTVHAAAHMLDGFFGVDSAFYNLIDDSHWVSQPLRARIRQNPSRFWLVKAVGISRRPEVDRVPFLRRHGRE